MSKRKRTSRGKEFCGAHTTCTETTEKFIEMLDTISSVKKFALGPIELGGSSSCNCPRIKIGFGDRGMISCVVSGEVAVQDVFVYSDNVQETKLILARRLRTEGYCIRFERKQDEKRGERKMRKKYR